MALWFAAAGILFLVMREVGPIWSMAILWFLVLVAAHVLANTWGSTVRNSPRRAIERGEESPRSSRPLERPMLTPQRAPTLRRSITSGRFEYYFSGLAALGATGAGGTLLANHYWEKLGYAALALGAFSFGVIAALFGFMLGTFFRVIIQAWRDAGQASRPSSGKRAAS